MADLINFTVGMWKIFVPFENEHQALTFLDVLNSGHQNLKFCIEFPSFDVLNTHSKRHCL